MEASLIYTHWVVLLELFTLGVCTGQPGTADGYHTEVTHQELQQKKRLASKPPKARFRLSYQVRLTITIVLFLKSGLGYLFVYRTWFLSKGFLWLPLLTYVECSGRSLIN